MKKATVLFTLSVLALFFYHNTAFAQSELVGTKATDFKLKNIDGSNVALESYNEKEGIILVFTCNHCPFSKLYEDRIIELNAKYADAGFPVVAINSNDPVAAPDDSFDKMKERAKEKKFTFPYLYDETQEIAKAYKATRTPHVYLLQRTDEGFFIRYIGAIDDNAQDAKAVTTKYLEDAIASLQKGKDIGTPHTKAVGCTIKWKQ